MASAIRAPRVGMKCIHEMYYRARLTEPRLMILFPLLIGLISGRGFTRHCPASLSCPARFEQGSEILGYESPHAHQELRLWFPLTTFPLRQGTRVHANLACRILSPHAERCPVLDQFLGQGLRLRWRIISNEPNHCRHESQVRLRLICSPVEHAALALRRSAGKSRL